jgi:hypothetical protein
MSDVSHELECLVKFIQRACVPCAGPVEWLVAGRTIEEQIHSLSAHWP